MEDHHFHLRPFHSDDLPKLFELDQLCFRPGIAYSQDELREFISHPAAIIVVAEDFQSKIVAFAVLELYRKRKRIIGHIITLDVHPDYRRLGLGRQLMAVLREIGERSGTTLMSLEVAIDDEGAQAFYSRLGFITVGKLKNYYLHRIDALSMELAIEPVSK